MIYWDRPTLKERAKNVLKNSYWMSFLVMFIFGILGGRFNFNFHVDAGDYNNFAYIGSPAEFWQQFSYGMQAIMASAFTFVAIGAGAVGILFKVFVTNVFEVGKCRFFTLSRYASINIEELIFGFKHGKYLDNVKTMFLKNLYVFLWSLLFIIPGIIKGLAYFMVPYIIAENPNISTERALEISEKTTQGEKWDIFVLGLSFIGWYMLGILACGLGVLFVNPYSEATYAELYGALRLKAVQTGIATKDEIGAEL